MGNNKYLDGKFEIPSLYYAITNHDWIHRVWTFQEFILGRAITLQLGHFSLPWQAIAKGINPTTSRRRDAVQESALVSLATTRDTWKKIGRDASHASISPVERANYLLYTLAWTFECMSIRVCSEPLDRIFALYGLLRNAGLALPMPDYEASTDDVERAVTWSCITATNSLLILYYLDLYRHRTGGSTWSINWMHSRTVHPSRGVFEEYRRTRISTFRPGSETRMENDRLMVEGINYGQVELIGSVVPDSNPDESDSSYMYRLQRWFRVLASLAANLQDCPDGMDARYALVAAFYEGFQGKIHAQRDFMLEVHLKLLGFTRKQSPDDIVADIVNNIDATTLESHLVNVARQCAGGSAFRTSQGWVGITQEPLRTTDQLALLHGSAVPVVLRPRDDSYALIGFASVKGILEESWPLTGEEVGTQEIVLM